METWYFETSAVNAFMEGRGHGDALATRLLQKKKGREWRLSPVTLWEILMTSDEQRRDEIVCFCQHLFSPELLPAPGELIIDYIKQGMPKTESKCRLISNTLIAETWKTLVDDRSQTFFLDYKELRRKVKFIQKMTQDIIKVVTNTEKIANPNDYYSALDYSLNNMVNKLEFVKYGDPLSAEKRLAYKVSFYYIVHILCSEGDIDNQPIKGFWSEIGIDSTLERIGYVVKYMPNLVHRGPFILMSYMTISQAREGWSRGVGTIAFMPCICHTLQLCLQQMVIFVG